MLLQSKELDLTLSISVTTRARRSSEVDGIHYSFITKKQFEALRDGGDLLEWAEVHGNFYGTPREPAEQVLDQGRDMLFDIDYQGTQQVKQKAAGGCRHDFYLAAIDAGIAFAPRTPRRGPAGRHRQAFERGAQRNPPLDGL